LWVGHCPSAAYRLGLLEVIPMPKTSFSERLSLIETLTIEPTIGTKNDSLGLRWKQPGEPSLDQKSRRIPDITKSSRIEAHNQTVCQGHITRN
jgi:hypothetical protein